MISRHVGRLALAVALLATQSALAADPIKIGVPITLSPPGSVPQGILVRDALMVAAKNQRFGRRARPSDRTDH